MIDRLRCCWRTLASVAAAWSILGPAWETRAGTGAAYEAEVVETSVFVLCGPGVGYYPTTSLPLGERVTVVGERIGAWVAILPPSASFSWVPAVAVQEQPDGTGRITTDGTQVRIGSELTDARGVYQVSLNQGTGIHILDRVWFADDGRESSWYKILPSPGEVRYVKASQLGMPRPGRLASSSRFSPLVKVLGGRPGITLGAGSSTPPLPADPLARRAIGTRVIPPAEPIRRSRVRKVSSAELGPGPPVTITDDPARPPQARLESLAAQLEMMRSRSPELWDIETPRTILFELLAAARDVPSRTQARDLLARVRDLERLKDRYERSRRQWELTLERDRELASAQERKEQELLALAPPFVAEGILKGAALWIGDEETYKLTDARGTTTHYVVPLPGLNLRSYLGTRVGLTGKLGRRPGLPVPLLVADQLVPLEARMARPVTRGTGRF